MGKPSMGLVMTPSMRRGEPPPPRSYSLIHFCLGTDGGGRILVQNTGGFSLGCRCVGFRSQTTQVWGDGFWGLWISISPARASQLLRISGSRR